MSDSFFSRWSRQKTLNRELDQARDAAVAKAPLPAEAEAVPVPKPPVEGAQAVDLPTQADAEALDGLLKALTAVGVESLTTAPPSLEQVFLQHYGKT